MNADTSRHLSCAGGPAHILVADDEADIRELIVLLLELDGYRVTGVEHGQAAITASSEIAFDLAVLDVTMPGVGGLRAAEAMRAARPLIKIVFHTAMEEKGWVDACCSAHDAYFRKPLAADPFLAEIGRLLQ